MTWWFNDVVYWYWLILAAILIIVEIFVPTAYFLFMGVVAALMAGILYVFSGISFLVQVLLFAILAIIGAALCALYKKSRPAVANISAPNLNVRGQQYIGRTLVLTEPIINGFGRAKVGDSVWRVRGQDSPRGSSVNVVSVESNTLIVEAVLDNAD